MFTIISYATEGAYKDVLETHLLPSVLRFNLPNSIDIIPSKGDWNRNTGYKPRFILKKLEELNTNVLFLDADAVIKGDITGLESLVGDDCLFACHFLRWAEWYGQKGSTVEELLSGTLWVRNCPETKQLCREWGEQCEKSHEWEQKVLYKIAQNNNLKVFNLPLPYCYITTMPDGTPPKIKCSEVLIEHHQVSRKLKRTNHL